MDALQCNECHWDGLTKKISFEDGVPLNVALSKEGEFRRSAALAGSRKWPDNISGYLYAAIEHDPMLDTITTVNYFYNTPLTWDEIESLEERMPDTEFRVIYNKAFCNLIAKEEHSKEIRPITLREANEFVEKHHRHHAAVTGCKFAISLYKKTRKNTDELIGVAICGRPVSRILDDGRTLEINRLCVIENGNSCSMLYGAAIRIAKDMGYKKVITYILESEFGSSLKASGFVLEDSCCGGPEWTGKRSGRTTKTPKEYKQRWVKYL